MSAEILAVHRLSSLGGVFVFLEFLCLMQAHGFARGSSDWATALLVLKSTVGGTLIVIPAAYKARCESLCMFVHCARKVRSPLFAHVLRRVVLKYG